MSLAGAGPWHVPAAAGAPALLFSATVEEWFFRGWIQERLSGPPRRALGALGVLGAPVGREVPLAALAFALCHLPQAGPARALATFAPGLVFGWCRARTGSIWSAIAVHAGYDAWALAFSL